MQARDISEVLTLLEEVIARTIKEDDAHGIFAALYYQMTRRVKQGIDEGRFDDGARMNRFDTIFANRYFEALTQRSAGQEPSRSWRVAFSAAREADNIALQHMLLGVNAHINFDLPIAAEQTAHDNIEALQQDFERINVLIAALLDEAQAVLNENSRGMRLIDLLGGDIDEWLASFSIEKMRQHAWEEAVDLAELSEKRRKRAILVNDRRVARLGTLITRPPRALQTAVDLIRLGERGRTVAIIKGLQALPIDTRCLEG